MAATQRDEPVNRRGRGTCPCACACPASPACRGGHRRPDGHRSGPDAHAPRIPAQSTRADRRRHRHRNDVTIALGEPAVRRGRSVALPLRLGWAQRRSAARTRPWEAAGYRCRCGPVHPGLADVDGHPGAATGVSSGGGDGCKRAKEKSAVHAELQKIWARQSSVSTRREGCRQGDVLLAFTPRQVVAREQTAGSVPATPSRRRRQRQPGCRAASSSQPASGPPVNWNSPVAKWKIPKAVGRSCRGARSATVADSPPCDKPTCTPHKATPVHSPGWPGNQASAYCVAINATSDATSIVRRPTRDAQTPAG